MIDEAAQCHGKAAFTDKVTALDVARRTGRRRSKSREGGLAPYRCELCGQWHVGNRGARSVVQRSMDGQRRRHKAGV